MVNILVLQSIEFCVGIFCVSIFIIFYPFVDAALFYKDLSDEGVPVSVILPTKKDLEPLLLKTEYYHLAIIVDVACEDSIQFISEVRQRHVHFCSLFH